MDIKKNLINGKIFLNYSIKMGFAIFEVICRKNWPIFHRIASLNFSPNS